MISQQRVPQYESQLSSDEEKTFSRLIVVGLVLTALTYVHAIGMTWPTLNYSPDSWSYLELAKTFDRDIYRFNTFRSYFSETYSASFPFGYPFILYLFQRTFGSYEGAGLLINVALVLITPFLAELFSRVYLRTRGVGFVSGVVLVLYPPYIDEVTAGRSIPMTISFCLLALAILGRAVRQNSLGLVFLSGIIAGIPALLRFDALLPAIALSLFVFMRAESVSLGLTYLVGVAVSLSPWMVYSLNYFEKIYVSDNNWIVLSSTVAYVTDYPAQTLSSAFAHPLEWLGKVIVNLLKLTRSVATILAKYGAPIFIGVGAIVRLSGRRAPLLFRDLDRGFIYILLCYIVGLASYIIAGYFDHRYFSMTFFLVFLTSMMIFAGECAKTNGKKTKMRQVLVAALVSSALVANAWAYVFWTTTYVQKMTQDIRDRVLMTHLAECHRREPSVLYLFEDGRFAARFGSTYGFKTGMLPGNWHLLDESTKSQFEQRFGPSRFFNVAMLRSASVSGLVC